jgi:hypothetical protein
MPRTKQAARRSHSNEATPEEKKEKKRAKKQRRNLRKKEELKLLDSSNNNTFAVNWVIDRIGVIVLSDEEKEEQPQFKKQQEQQRRELRDECYHFDLYHRDVTYYGGACLTSKYEIAEYAKICRSIADYEEEFMVRYVIDDGSNKKRSRRHSF